jgi:hypothetical protein
MNRLNSGRGSLSLACALAAALATGCFGGSGSSSSDGSITIDNASSHVLTRVCVAPVDQVSWGPNLLPDVLYTNEELTISVACNSYDVLITDDSSRDCVLGNLDLCFSDKVWTVDNSTLRNCGF